MLRTIGAIIAGIITFFVVVTMLNIVSSLSYPLPEGLDPFDPTHADALATHMASQPLGAWLFPFFGEMFGAFAGCLVAANIERRHALWIIIGITGLAIAGSVTNWMSFSHPAWFMIGQLIGYPALGWLAWRGTRSPRDIPVDPNSPTIPIGDAITERRTDERADDT
jgi:hypothetical protein